ncbi:MAG: DinB family protein [Balneolaceae bacterium]|nr:DinB family protein [Balneolaceae bacterium]
MELLDPAAGFKPWHGGPSLSGCLRGVDVQQAAWKPAPGRHSIWELALHIAYWKYAVRRYLDPGAEKGFARSPANWPELSETSESAWKQDLVLIKSEHDKLVDAIRSFPETRLNEKIAPDKEWTFIQLLSGIAAHDTYHIGQIQLMKRLYKEINPK